VGNEVIVVLLSFLWDVVVVFLIRADSTIIFICWTREVGTQGADAFCLKGIR